MKTLAVPGLSLAVIRDGKVIKIQGYGLANVENSVPATPDTAYLLASMTKQFTAAAIMMLEEEGKLALDDPICKHLREPADAWKEITIRDLLGHTAGLKDGFEEETLDGNKWRRVYSTQQMYQAARQRPLDFAPGTGWQYSDQGYFLLGVIIERVSGQTYRDFLKKRIFEPLGMTASTTVNQQEIVPHMASGYALAGERLIHNHRNMDFGMTSHFGMISTVIDLVKWDAALRERKLLRSASYDLMWTPVSLRDGSRSLGPAGAYGFGWFLDKFRGHRLISHAGASGTAILLLPDDGLTVIVLTNLELLAGGNAPAIARDIAALFIPRIDWSQLKESPDPDPKLTARLRGELGNLAAGKPDFSLYMPQVAAEMRKQIDVIKSTYSQLGKIEQPAFCESEMDGASRSLYYKLKCETVPMGFFIRYTFNEKGEIAFALSSTQ
jgi:CubicO group peptidase (beta-lactamase class C family)